MLSATLFVGALIFPAAIHAQAPTPLSQTAINTYNRYTHYAAAIFCKADVVKDWACGSKYTHLNHFRALDSSKKETND